MSRLDSPAAHFSDLVAMQLHLPPPRCSWISIGFTDVLALERKKDKNRLTGSHTLSVLIDSGFNATRGRPLAIGLCSDCRRIKMLDNDNR